MYGSPDVWHALMEKLAEMSARYVAAQVEAGADAVQLFDSWAGALSVEDYGEFAARYSARILGAVAAPTIHFATGATHLLRSLAAAGGDAIGLDWRLPARRRLALGRRGPGGAGQPRPGRPARPVGARRGGARAVLERARRRPGHIFNLGHGVLPQTDPDALSRLTSSSSRRRSRRASSSPSARDVSPPATVLRSRVRAGQFARGPPRLLPAASVPRKAARDTRPAWRNRAEVQATDPLRRASPLRSSP
jgi:uroporphyrinogen decarboxylase